MSAGWAAFIADHHEQESPAERAVRLARAADQRDDRTAERADDERRAALAERHELVQLAAMRAGVAARSVGDVFADASRLGDEDAEYGEALKTIERIDRRRASRQRDQVLQAQRMAEVTGLASRSATGGSDLDLLAGAKATLAGHREYVQASRAARSAAQAGTPRRARPFAAGRGGEVARSHLDCVYCQQQNVDAETSTLLHHDPQYPVPITTVKQAEAAREADRLQELGYSAETARLAQRPIGRELVR